MRTPALEPKNRLLRHFACLEAAKYGQESALAGLPFDPNCLKDPDEQEAYAAEWRHVTATLALSAGRLAEAEDRLDSSERQPKSFMEYVIQKFFKRKG